jgi:hypothetical protein
MEVPVLQVESGNACYLGHGPTQKKEIINDKAAQKNPGKDNQLKEWRVLLKI